MCLEEDHKRSERSTGDLPEGVASEALFMASGTAVYIVCEERL